MSLFYFCGGKFIIWILYIRQIMIKEMREQINKVKNWKQFLNESKSEQSDSFITHNV